MKKYSVVRVLEYLDPIVVFQTDEYKDACDYADIMHRNDGCKYAVVELTDLYEG